MPKGSYVTAAIEPELKAKVDAILVAAGMKNAQAIRAFYLYIARNGRLPFDLFEGITDEDLERARSEIETRDASYAGRRGAHKKTA